MTMLDANTIRGLNPCRDYTDRRLANLFDRPMTLSEVLARQDGAWSDVPAIDRQWVFWRAATREQLSFATERIVTRAITDHALKCGLPDVETWAKDWLNGKDRSKYSAAAGRLKALDMRRAAAEAAAAAVFAAWRAAEAALAADCWSHAGTASSSWRVAAAEREKQLADMLAVLYPDAHYDL